MRTSLHVRVITSERVVYEGEALAVQFPGEDGLYGVLPNHAAMITTVDAGVIKLREREGSEHHLFVSRGFAQVSNGELRFAVDSGEDEDEIDIERAREAATRARERLQKQKQQDIDSLRAQYALRRALMRLRAKGARA